jgi:fucokinase
MTEAGRCEAAVDLADTVRRTRRLYASRVAGSSTAAPWWTAVVITASSERQAERYRWELHRRTTACRIPSGVKYLVVPDVAGERIGSGAATLNALRALIAELPVDGGAPSPFDLTEWWSGQRVLLIHSGGDSRRLPQYSPSGKLFSAVPVTTPWGNASTVFDETLTLSTAWVERLSSGMVVGSGDVILTFDASSLNWELPGVSGVAMLQPVEAGMRHGVYVTDEQERVYSFLQKPSISELNAAGGLLAGNRVALDTGLLRFAPEAAARLSRLAGVEDAGGTLAIARSILETPTAVNGKWPAIDLYTHVTMGLTGQWKPEGEDVPLHALWETLKGLPFWCSIVSGDFTHVGTTSLFRKLMTGETDFSRLHEARQQFGVSTPPGVRSAGVVIDSVLGGGAELGAETVVIECNLGKHVRAAAGSILHGLDGISCAVEVPENAVVHQLPVTCQDGRRGVVIRAYAVEDDPRLPVMAENATWFGRPPLEHLSLLGIDADKVWPRVPPADRTLWNARLFPVTTADEAWTCAQWMQGLSADYSAERWSIRERLSLGTSAQLADGPALEAARSRRLSASWRIAAISLVESGADIRPLLAHSPGTGPLAETAEALRSRACELEASAPTEAASRSYSAGLFYGQAGFAGEASEAQGEAFRLVERAVEIGASGGDRPLSPCWQREEVTVEAPARIDLGGGWSDTPPFCIDWGGTVLNMAVELGGCYPIKTTIRRLPEPVVRCVAGTGSAATEFRSCDDLLGSPLPGSPLSVPMAALQMTGLLHREGRLADIMERMGGGIEITSSVDLPMGSGLGTSSILAATVLRALSEMTGVTPDDHALSGQVMRLEQLMTTGGGWQDQAGGIFPGAKLVVTGPGLHQHLRVHPLKWTGERQAEFEDLLLLYYTGIDRIARGLLRQVVGRYLARETACVQVLHSIKTLAMEMAYALEEGEWDHLGCLLDRHWALNQILDPNTTNTPINALLEAVRPYIRGAKLAGAGGGGFLLLLARSPDAARDLRRFLGEEYSSTPSSVYNCRVATSGLRTRSR